MDDFSVYHNQLIELIYDDEFDCLEVGILLAEDDEHILLLFINPEGLENGYSLIHKQAVNMVKTNTRYLQRIKLLQELQQGTTFASPILRHEPMATPNAPLLENVLKLVKQNHWLCNIVRQSETKRVFGFVDNIHQASVDVAYLGEHKSVELSDIVHIYINCIQMKVTYFLDTHLTSAKG